jgi:hypothetical protein
MWVVEESVQSTFQLPFMCGKESLSHIWSSISYGAKLRNQIGVLG